MNSTYLATDDLTADQAAGKMTPRVLLRPSRAVDGSLIADAFEQIFRSARTYNEWSPREVDDQTIRD